MSYAVGLRLPKDMTADPNRSLKLVAFGVVFFHLVFITIISMQKYETPIPVKPVQKLIVHTVNLDSGMRVQQSSPKSSQKGGKSAPAAAIPEAIPEPEPEVVLPKEIEPEPEPVIESEPESIPEPETVEETPPPPAPKPKVVKEVKPAKPKAAVKKTVEKKKTPKKTADKPKVVEKAKPTPKKTADKPKKEAAKKDPVKKATQKKETTPAVAKPDPKAEALTAKKRELIAQAQASMAKIGKSTGGSGSGNTKNLAIGSVPSAISALNADSFGTGSGDSLTVMETSYRNELASRLKRLLTLPEHGDVKIKLKLDKSGKFLSVSIVSAQNSVNKKYIEKTLPTLTFPPFGSNFSGHQDYTFSITLSNNL